MIAAIRVSQRHTNRRALRPTPTDFRPVATCSKIKPLGFCRFSRSSPAHYQKQKDLCSDRFPFCQSGGCFSSCSLLCLFARQCRVLLLCDKNTQLLCVLLWLLWLLWLLLLFAFPCLFPFFSFSSLFLLVVFDRKLIHLANPISSNSFPLNLSYLSLPFLPLLPQTNLSRCVKFSLFTLARPVARSVTPAGSFTASSTVSSRMARCPLTRL